MDIEGNRSVATPLNRLHEGTSTKRVASRNPVLGDIVTICIKPEAMSEANGTTYGKWSGLEMMTDSPYEDGRVQYRPSSIFKLGRKPVGLEQAEHRIFEDLRTRHGFKSDYPRYSGPTAEPVHSARIPRFKATVPPEPTLDGNPGSSRRAQQSDTPPPQRAPRDWSHVFGATMKRADPRKRKGEPLVVRVTRMAENGKDATPFEMAKYADALRLHVDPSGKFDRVVSIFKKPVGVDFYALQKNELPRYSMLIHADLSDDQRMVLEEALYETAQSVGLETITTSLDHADNWYSLPSKKIKDRQLDRVLVEMPPIGRKPINAAKYDWTYQNYVDEKINIKEFRPLAHVDFAKFSFPAAEAYLAAIKAVYEANSATIAQIRRGSSVRGHTQSYVDAIAANIRLSANELAPMHKNVDGSTVSDYHEAMKAVLPTVLSEASYELENEKISNCTLELAKALPLNNYAKAYYLPPGVTPKGMSAMTIMGKR